MGCHDPVRTILDLAHDQVGVVDSHMLIIRVRFTAAQEIGQVNRQKTHTRQTGSELFRQELGHVGFLAVPVGIRWADFRYRHTQVSSLGEQHYRIVERVPPILRYQPGERVDIGRHLGDQHTVSPGNGGRFERREARVPAKHAEKHGLTVRSGGGADARDKLRRPADGGLEADTEVGAGYIVIHGLGNAPDGHPFR